ncbi:MAG: TRAP transporter substrate-binding protein [Gammaproteobacteria bacterium]|nr:TRAP transporter substrate-binding protein [Gammaproteobacteria bacterium]
MSPRVAWVLCCAVLLLAGCDAGERTGMEVTVAGTAAARTAGEEQWLMFQRAVEASDEDITMRMLIYGQLGSEEALVSGLRRGRVQFANLSAMAASTVLPELALLYAPYLFDSYAEADYVFDTYLTPVFRELLAERGLHLVTWNEIGFHHVYAKRPLMTPAQMRGVRFRVSASPASQLFARALGADVISVGFGDIVPSLQTGLMEAGENGVPLYARTGIAGEAPHLMLTAHSLGMSVIVADLRWWNGLTDAQRELFGTAFPDISVTRRMIREEIDRDLAISEAELGFVSHELTVEQRALWVEATRGTHDDIIRTLGGRSREIYELIEQGRASWQARGAAAYRSMPVVAELAVDFLEDL